MRSPTSSRTWSRPMSSFASGRKSCSSILSNASASSRSRSASMPLVKNLKIVEDRFVRVLDETPIADDAAVLVPAARLTADAVDLLQRGGRTGVFWPNNRNRADFGTYVARLDVVALTFPKFQDGRAYSQARLLRERYGYSGELRATGQVLRDQFLFLIRAGFDAFEVTKPADAEHFAEAARRYSAFYQPAGDN